MKFGKDSLADEYLKEFPGEIGHASILQQAELEYLQQMEFNKTRSLKEALFGDDDCHQSFKKRWGSLVKNEHCNITRFLSNPRRKFGDVYRRKTFPVYNDESTFKTMLDTSFDKTIYIFGKTHVSMSYQDLFQLACGQYIREDANEIDESIIFYGYDGNQVATLRSKIIYGAMKYFSEDQIRIESLLQIWFSSCWEKATLTDFNMIINDALYHPEKYQIEEKDKPLLKKWKDASITVSDAQKQFSVGCNAASFQYIFGMTLVRDQVLYSRYLLTGVIFTDKKMMVCGNPTVFTEHQGRSKAPGESFFNAITLEMVVLCKDAIKSMIQTFEDCIFSRVMIWTINKIVNLRKFVSCGTIICHLNTEAIDLKNNLLASKIKNLDPWYIEWSNIPEYFPKDDFFKFAKECSGKQTIHILHFQNIWCESILGASYLDWVGNEDLLNIYHQRWKEFFNIELTTEAKESNHIWHFIKNEDIQNYSMHINTFLAVRFRQDFEDFFFRKGNIKIVEKGMYNLLSNIFFHRIPPYFRTLICFNEKLSIINNVVS